MCCSFQSGFCGLDIHRNGEALWDVNGNFSTEMYTEEAEKIISTHDPSEVTLVVLYSCVGVVILVELCGCGH